MEVAEGCYLYALATGAKALKPDVRMMVWLSSKMPDVMMDGLHDFRMHSLTNDHALPDKFWQTLSN